MATVAVLGGGIGGLSAAHELVERGYEVAVWEASGVLGGKAASQPIPGTGKDGRLDLPGEHGFRFYPGFYTHLIDTMARIPVQGGTVAERLIASDEAGIAAEDGNPIHIFSRRPLRDPRDLVDGIVQAFANVEAEEADVARFAWQVLVYLTSSAARRREEYSRISWWDFLEAHEFSKPFQGYVRAVPRTMVAMDPEHGAAKTIGDISMQLLLDFGERAWQNDRTLDGPTSERWIDPWAQYLRGRGVRFHLQAPVVGLEVKDRRIHCARLASGEEVEADWFVSALPLEVMHRLVTDGISSLDEGLGRFRAADPRRLTSWMVGAQFFLKQDVPVVRGHQFFPHSEWALTAISQAQFWERRGARFADTYGDGSIHGVLSVDISDWTTKSAHTGLAASETPSRDAILDEIWRQLKAGLNGLGDLVLRDENVALRHLDQGIVFPPGGGLPVNKTPLLVHPPGHHDQRPQAATAIENLLLASDYVQTETDLASMEGANEAARRAVNALLDRAGDMAAERCQLWPLQEPAVFAPARRLDEMLFRAGHPHYMNKLDDLGLDDLGELGLELPGRLLRRLRPKLGLDWVRMVQRQMLDLED